MAIKKSELYSSLWESCDNLRGGMDSSQYKDYILVLLFVKYVSDKLDTELDYLDIPESATFDAMVKLKGNPEIGDKINKEIVAPLAEACGLSVKAMPDFNDSTKLGDGEEKVERLTDLIGIFQRPELNFSNNKASGDDLLGDAFEYLMGHFATESGKSKGQFYTPTEVSRIIADVVGIDEFETKGDTTVYDPTCGSGSLLLKVAAKADREIALYGQEKDTSTSILAQMNMFLHNAATAEIVSGNTLANPKFIENNELKRFDFVVANPPFSDKKWSIGVGITDDNPDKFGRFTEFGVPPTKQGDYAYFLHILKSLKPTGKAAIVLPHGVLFRGNAEADIRRELVDRGLIKAIIGLPGNLFYGTGIPACIIVIDKEHANARKGILMIDASKGFVKDGAKNRLREQDIHRIVDAFKNPGEESERFARMVSTDEIIKNGYNLNLPRYIDNSDTADVQDIAGHLQGGIPMQDVEELADYWKVSPQLKNKLFTPLRDGYVELTCEPKDVKQVINDDAQFVAFKDKMQAHFASWEQQAQTKLKALGAENFKPKELIKDLSESLLAHYKNTDLVNDYAIYQILMDYWAGIMSDDAYIIATDDWKAEAKIIIETDKKGKQKTKGWEATLIPKQLVVNRYFKTQFEELMRERANLEALQQTLTEHEENNAGEEGVLEQGIKEAEVKALWQENILESAITAYAVDYQTYKDALSEQERILDEMAKQEEQPIIKQLIKSSKTVTAKKIKDFMQDKDTTEQMILTDYGNLVKRLADTKKVINAKIALFDTGINEKVAELDKQLADTDETTERETVLDNQEALLVLYRWLSLSEKVKKAKELVKNLDAKLDQDAFNAYTTLTEQDVKEMVVDEKWLADLGDVIYAEVERVAQRLSVRVRELAERYDSTLAELTKQVAMYEGLVSEHLVAMGFEV